MEDFFGGVRSYPHQVVHDWLDNCIIELLKPNQLEYEVIDRLVLYKAQSRGSNNILPMNLYYYTDIHNIKHLPRRVPAAYGSCCFSFRLCSRVSSAKQKQHQ